MKASSRSRALTLRLTRGAAVAALYTVLTLLSAMLGLSSGVIQFRLSELLCVLPLFIPEAIGGLFIGCAVSNLITGCAVWDIIFGSIATLLGALGAYALRRIPEGFKWTATLPTVLSNAVIVPFVLMYAYGVEDAYAFLFLTVGVGEIVCAGVGGYLFYRMLKPYSATLFR